MLCHIVAGTRHKGAINAFLGSQSGGTIGRLRDHTLGRALEDDRVQFFLERLRPKANLAVCIHDKRATVEHQLVLATDHIHIKQRNASFRNPRANRFFSIHLHTNFIRRAVDRDHALGTGAAAASHWPALPDVFADSQPQTDAVDFENGCVFARREIAFLIEHAVVRQDLLAIVADRVTVQEHATTVVNLIVVVLGKADQNRDAEQLVSNFSHGVLYTMAQSRVEQEVLRRIATDAELGKDNEIRTMLVAGPARIFNYFGRVAGDITDREIELC